jgi:hypothetical protein
LRLHATLVASARWSTVGLLDDGYRLFGRCRYLRYEAATMP